MFYIVVALLSAMFFGASTPLCKSLLDSIPPFKLAGLLYLGASFATLPFLLRESSGVDLRRMGKINSSRLLSAIAFGGIFGPVLLLMGLEKASAASVSLWLNLELVATALLGVLFFKDHLGRYGWIGVGGTLLASLLLTWHESSIGVMALTFIGLACIAWGLDNHLTALIDGITPTQSTFWKGLIAGSTNFLIGMILEPGIEAPYTIGLALIVGVFSYGLSITLHITAAQSIGATRSQMIFGSAPFFGVALSSLFLGETLSVAQLIAGTLLIASLVVLFMEQHMHEHTHETLSHKHLHSHDAHHKHAHDQGKVSETIHSHWHTHDEVRHTHPHWPDIHHRHTHS